MESIALQFQTRKTGRGGAVQPGGGPVILCTYLP